MGRKNKKRSSSSSSSIMLKVDDQKSVISKPLSIPFMQMSLNICINPISSVQIMIPPEIDVPHPRYLCFQYPFSRTSHRRHHCIKCFCFLCGTVVPCSKWVRRPLRHCDSTMEFDQLCMKRKLRELLDKPDPLSHYKLFINLIRGSSETMVEGFAGGIIQDGNGNWVTGFSLKISYNDPTFHIHILIAIYEGLKLAFSKSELIKILDVHLGIPFQPNLVSTYFNSNGNENQDEKRGVSLLARKLLPWTHSPDYNDDLYALLDSIEYYLNNPDWKVLIHIYEAKSVNELSTAAYALIHYARHQREEKDVYEFPTNPLTQNLKVMASMIKRGITGWMFAAEDDVEAMDFVANLTSDNFCLLHCPPNIWLVHHSPRHYSCWIEPVVIPYELETMEDQSVIQEPNQVENVDDIDSLIDSMILSMMSENDQDQGQLMHKILCLSLCIKPEDDFPHPRHLCFTYPFGKTSPKKHCKKCYCYVCEEIAPCKAWEKSPKGHCHATEKEEMWKSAREGQKKKNGVKTTMAYHKLTISFMNYPPDQPRLVDGFGGGLICNGKGDWITGFSMPLQNFNNCDCAVPPFLTLIEGLELAWSRGIRNLEVELGFLYHEGFWLHFDKDNANGKFYIRQPDPAFIGSSNVLKRVELNINRDGFIDVKNTPTYKEEVAALAITMLAYQIPFKQVYDFPSHPLTHTIKEMVRDIESENKHLARFNPCKDVRIYAGLTY